MIGYSSSNVLEVYGIIAIIIMLMLIIEWFNLFQDERGVNTIENKIKRLKNKGIIPFYGTVFKKNQSSQSITWQNSITDYFYEIDGYYVCVTSGSLISIEEIREIKKY